MVVSGVSGKWWKVVRGRWWALSGWMGGWWLVDHGPQKSLNGPATSLLSLPTALFKNATKNITNLTVATNTLFKFR